MTQPEKEKQSYKLGHNRQKKTTSHFKDLSLKNEWHVHGHSRVFHVSRYICIEVIKLFLIIHKNF